MYFLPDIPIIMRFRGRLYGLGMKQCGKDFQVAHDVKLINLETISVGNNSYIAYTSLLIANPKGEIVIGDRVMIGPHCVLVSDNHTSIDGSYRFGKCIDGNIKIEDGSWIGAHCTVLLNSVLPKNSCLGANSLLNKKYQIPNSIYFGSPAKLHCKE